LTVYFLSAADIILRHLIERSKLQQRLLNEPEWNKCTDG